MILISIIITVYNTEKYLDKLFLSLKDQLYENVELIFIDDGSKDGSGKKCDLFKETYNKVIVYHQSNMGVSAARNKGIDLSNGEYLWFVDSDDFIEPLSFKKIIDYLKNEINFDLITFSHYEIFNNGNLRKYLSLPIKDQSIFLDQISYYKLMYNNKVGFWAVWKHIFFKKIINKNHLRFNTDYVNGEDLDFFLRYTYLSNNFLLVNSPLLNYLNNRIGSTTQVYSTNALLNSLQVLSYHFLYCKDHNLIFLKKLIANNYANTITKINNLYHVKEKDKELKKIFNIIRKNKSILLHVYGFKHKFSRFIWKTFGFYNGNKIINRIRTLILGIKL